MSAQPLRLVKRAFQLDGTPIASGSTVPHGMPVKFLIYIDNPGNATTDVRVHDTLEGRLEVRRASTPRPVSARSQWTIKVANQWPTWTPNGCPEDGYNV